jgi:hypothetical protein
MQRVLIEADNPDTETRRTNGHGASRKNLFPRPQNTRHDQGYIPRKKIGGTHSRAIDRGGLSWAINGLSREGRFITEYQNLLVEHLRREPSITERLLIQRCARMALHIELMDEAAFAKGESYSPSDNVRYVAWSNGLARMLVRLGLEPGEIEEPRANLSDWIKDRSRRYSHAAK